jgi:hypothetical protein
VDISLDGAHCVTLHHAFGRKKAWIELRPSLVSLGIEFPFSDVSFAPINLSLTTEDIFLVEIDLPTGSRTEGVEARIIDAFGTRSVISNQDDRER